MDFRIRDPMTLQIRLRGDLLCEPRPDGLAGCCLIEDPLRGKFFRLGRAEWLFISQLDGRRTLRDVIAQTSAMLGADAVSETEALQICQWLVENELAIADTAMFGTHRRKPVPLSRRQPWWSRVNVLSIQFPLARFDQHATRLAKVFSWLFAPPAVCGWGVLMFLAIYRALWRAEEFAGAGLQVVHPSNLFWLWATWVLLKLVHESGHAVACKRYGGTVPRAGLALLLFTPVAFVDVTSSWRFRSAWQRIVVALGGMYLESFLAAGALLAWTLISEPQGRALAFNVFATASVHTLLVNANPLLRFDGYYILSDLLGIPNLSSQGNSRWAYWAKRHLLGDSTAAAPPACRWPTLTAIYVVLASTWRGLMIASILAVILACENWLGRYLMLVLASVWLGLPAIQAARMATQLVSQSRPTWSRAALSATGAVAGAALAVWCLAREAVVYSPAVVEYADRAVLHAPAAGFVREIRVENGQLVQAGDILFVLENEDLTQDATDLTCQIEQAKLQEQLYGLAQELSKQQIEAGKRQSLETRLEELQGKLGGLTIHAPRAGRVVFRDGRSLLGVYRKEGDELAMVGSENEKELLIAFPQDDLNQFRLHLNRGVTLRLRHDMTERAQGELVEVQPSAQMALPHEALAGTVGGPIGVRPRQRDSAQENLRGPELEPLTPLFTAKVALPAEVAQRLQAGQSAAVLFSSQEQSAASRIWESSRRWLDEQIARLQR